MRKVNTCTKTSLKIGYQFSIKESMKSYPCKFNETGEAILTEVDFSTMFNITITSMLTSHSISNSKSAKLIRFQTINGKEFFVSWNEFKKSTIKQS